MKIDGHQHFWRYDAKEYGWIGEEMKALRRDFLPEHLKKEIETAGIDGVVSVQARQIVDETRWLLDMAEENEFIKGVVGWVELALRGVGKELERFASHPKLKGVRHVLQDEPANDLMDSDDFNAGIRMLGEFGLVYDILIFERHLPQAIRFVDRHPNQPFVLDHIAKPLIKDRVLSPWRENLRELARRENVSCKISGMVTEADRRKWKPSDFTPYIDTVMECFGARRVFVGSDWPVCTVAGSYSDVMGIVATYIERLSPTEQTAIWGENAQRIYRFGA